MNPIPFDELQAALFDLDGTLVDTHIDFALMKREMLALAIDYGVDAATVADWNSFDALRIVESARSWLIEHGRSNDADMLRSVAFARLERIEVQHCAAPDAVPGASALLHALADRGVRVAIVTRNSRTVATQLVAWAGLRSDALLTRDDVARTKPHPDHLLAALKALGLPIELRRLNHQDAEARRVHEADLASCAGVAPASGTIPNTQHPVPAAGRTPKPEHRTPNTEHRTPCIMVGDHWMDAQGGRAAGLWTVGLLRGRPREFFAPAPPDLVVEQLADLLPFVQHAAAAGPHGW